MKTLIKTFFILGLTFGPASFAAAQEDPGLSPAQEQKQKEKAEKEKQAYTLLEQVVGEAELLRLPENRVRVQIGAADLLWENNEGRARNLFAAAAEGVAELMRSTTANSPQGRGANRGSTGAQLRQELVLAVARHDATLAYQLLAATRPLTPPAGAGNSRFDSEDTLEERLLAQVAALDPKLALQNAEQMLDKGQFSSSLVQVLTQLQAKDKDAAAKLEDKLLKRLQSANMLSTPDAGTLALGLLRSGPRPADRDTTPVSSNSAQVLAPATYTSLLGTVIDAAIKATPPPAGTQRGAINFRGRRTTGRGGGGGRSGQNSVPIEPSPAELEQSNARRLLGGLQMMMPQVDQYLPGRSQAVRQKMTELGIADNSRNPITQVNRAIRQGTSESLLAAAPAAPQLMQSRIYQQAALRALEEGSAERARQIANDHLDQGARESVLQAVEFRQASEKMDGSKLADVRQTLAGLRTDDERIDMLLQLSRSARQNNRTLAVELLNEARQYTNRRAVNYRQLEQQLMLAEAFRDIEPARSFEILEPGIVQLNELLTAAATLSGFEVNVFQDGELPLEGRNGLSNMVTRFGYLIGLLAAGDFDQSQTLANRFHLSEPRIVARLSIVRSLLGKEQSPGQRGPRFGQNTFIRRGQ